MVMNHGIIQLKQPFITVRCLVMSKRATMTIFPPKWRAIKQQGGGWAQTRTCHLSCCHQKCRLTKWHVDFWGCLLCDMFFKWTAASKFDASCVDRWFDDLMIFFTQDHGRTKNADIWNAVHHILKGLVNISTAVFFCNKMWRGQLNFLFGGIKLDANVWWFFLKEFPLMIVHCLGW